MIMPIVYTLLILLLIPMGYAIYKSPAPFLMLGIPAVFALCCRANLGDAWMGGRASYLHLSAGIIYVLFWAVFTFVARRSRGMLRLCQIIALLGLGGALTGLMARSAIGDFLIIPALLLTPFSTVGTLQQHAVPALAWCKHLFTQEAEIGLAKPVLQQ